VSVVERTGCWPRRCVLWAVLATVLTVAGCASRSTVPVGPKGVLEVREGIATYYGKEFHGRPTASGVRFDMRALVAAHPTYPFGTLLRVTNVANGRSVQVRVVDRGPAAAARATGVVIDLSHRAAETLRFLRDGRVRVRLEVLRWGAA
jgi:rare lipoprotein A